MLLYKTYTIGKGGWSTLLGGFYNHVCGTHISPNPGPIWSPFVRFFLGEDHHLWLTVNFCLLFSAPFGYFRVFRGKLINRFFKNMAEGSGGWKLCSSRMYVYIYWPTSGIGRHAKCEYLPSICKQKHKLFCLLQWIAYL